MRDIRTTSRNGRSSTIVQVADDDELLMMTSRGKIQRIRAAEISVIGRNTQGVRIMSLDDGDSLAAVVRVPRMTAESRWMSNESGTPRRREIPATPPDPSSPAIALAAEGVRVKSTMLEPSYVSCTA